VPWAGCGVGRKERCRVAPAFLASLRIQPSRRSIVPRRPLSSQIRKAATGPGSVNRTQLRAHPLLFSHSSPPLVCISFPHSAHTMSPYNDQQPHPVIKSESPPLHSVPISSIGQPFSQYSDTGSLFRFGTKEQRVLPPFNFISRPRSSSSFSPHSAMSHLNAYSSTVSGSQSHFAVPPADDPGALTPTDEYDDGDETGDFPSGSGSSSKIDKSVRRRSSKGASRTLYLPPF
jgi:hypothetical protein